MKIINFIASVPGLIYQFYAIVWRSWLQYERIRLLSYGIVVSSIRGDERAAFQDMVISVDRFVTGMHIDTGEVNATPSTQCHAPADSMEQSRCLHKPNNKKAA